MYCQLIVRQDIGFAGVTLGFRVFEVRISLNMV